MTHYVLHTRTMWFGWRAIFMLHFLDATLQQITDAL
jgi:hypothetical protein